MSLLENGINLNVKPEELVCVVMKRGFSFLGLFIVTFSLVGCQSAKFTYNTPVPIYNTSGPAVQVMPIIDCRTNRAMDKCLEKGYMADVQRAIAGELGSMNAFCSVIVTTNAADPVIADLKLSPTLYRLEWNIPDYDALIGKAFAVGFFTGIVGGAIYASTSIDVHGHSALDFRVEQVADHRILLDSNYCGSVTNRLKKGVCDTPNTKARMMAQALQQTMYQVRLDLSKTAPISLQTNLTIYCVTNPFSPPKMDRPNLTGKNVSSPRGKN